MALIAVGLDHERAPLDLLERASIPEHEWPKVLRTLVAHRNVHEAVLVSTCLRTEVVARIDFFHGALEDIARTLAEASGVTVEELEPVIRIAFDRGVARHLFSVAGGLRSVVPGEFEVLGQLRRALEVALDEQTAGEEMSDLFHRAIASGRRVRAETSIARGTTSFASAAVTLAEELLGSDLAGAQVTVLGAGQLAEGVARTLLDPGRAISSLRLTNRTPTRATTLAAALDDDRVRVVDWVDRAATSRASRLVVVAVEAPDPVLGVEDLASSSDVLVVDLGMPRAVEPAVGDLSGVRRIDIDDLRARVANALDERRDALEAARTIVEGDVEHYLAERRSRGAAGIVRDLRAHLDDVVAAELERRASELATLEPDARDVAISLVRSTVAKIAHRPTVALKEAAGSDQGVRLADATRALFGL